MSDTSHGSDWWQASDGKWYPPTDRPAPPVAPSPVWWKRPRTIAVIIAIIVVAGLLIAFTRGDSGPSKTQAVDECHRIVRDRLKSPATAHFDADKPPDVTENASGSGKGNLVIGGTVDSENGFGANVRSDYICVAQLDGDRYTVDADAVIIL